MHVVRPLVLVADDSPDMRSLIKEVLEEEGYEVIALASGFLSLGVLKKSQPADLLR